MSSLEVLDDMVPVTPNDEWKFSVMVRLRSPFKGIKQQNKELMQLMEKFGDPNSDYMFTNARLGDLFHIRFKDSKLAAWFKLHKIIK
tara:strand:+ start:862 stop:1122 length:261 start_codon:yes stop_codon:yes gene_type:complete